MSQLRGHVRFIPVAVLGLAFACGSGVGDAPGSRKPGPGVGAPAPRSPSAEDSAPGAQAGTGAGVPSAAPGGGVVVAPDDPQAGSGELVPCAVAEVVSAQCTSCHARPARFGAPMPLATLADFHAPAVSDPERKVHELVAERINAEPLSRRMPPAPRELSAPDLGTLNDWLDAAAPAASGDGCAIAEPTDEPAPGSPVPTHDGVSTTPIEYDDPNLECFEFRAHGPAMADPHPVGAVTDRYVSFPYPAPWASKGTVYGRSFEPLIDNDQVLHHWLFFKSAGQRELVHGWAPGGSSVFYTPDLGAELPGDIQYELELHYNSSDASALDASGVKVCYTTTKPENVITMSWLGTDAIGGISATGTCRPPRVPATGAHILMATPHMHKTGTHMKVVVTRANGTQEVAHDQAFDFAYQTGYLEDLWIMPGDSITTTCTYSAPAVFGPGTSQEMCYWFTYYYPPLALTDSGIVGSLVHGNNTCLGL
jgi:hypothetical protein